MSDSAGVKKQVQGKCAEISEKNGWVTFSIEVGSQYPVRLSTKLDAIVKAGREAGQNVAVWTFMESEGGENPNKPGTNYKNRRLEKVEVGAQLDPALANAAPAAGATGGGGGYGGARTPDESRSIERQSLVKAAIDAFPTGKIETQDEWFTFLDRLDDWMGRTRAGSAPAAAPPAAAPAAAATPADEPPPHSDDDIPF